MKVFVVIPAYHEGRVLANVLNSLQGLLYQVVVVDDGSPDNTAQVARQAKVTVLKHLYNRGQGAALQTGIEYARSHGADIVVTFDADGQQDPSEIESVIKPLLLGQYDIVFGSRFLGQAKNMSLSKAVLLKGAIMINWLLAGIKLSDAHNGFRALGSRAIEQIHLRQDRMAHATEIVEQAKKFRWRYTEVPVTVLYTQYSKKKGQKITGGFRILFDLFLARFTK